MAMKPLKCPHCGKFVKNVAVTDSIAQMSLSHTSCSKCHKPFSWQGEYGRIVTYKE